MRGRKPKNEWGLPLTFALSGVAAFLLFWGPLFPLELKILDEHIRWRRVPFENPPVIIVAVDTPSLERLGDLPWNAEIVAQLLGRLLQGGATAIGISISLPPGVAHALPPSTRLLAKQRLVLAELLLRDPYDPSKGELLSLPPDLRELAATTGIANVETLYDGICRLQPLLYQTKRGNLPSWELRLFQVNQGLPLDEWTPESTSVLVAGRRIPTDRHHRLYLNYVGGTKTFPLIPAYKVIDGEVLPGIFQGKIVLVGAASPRLARDLPTPTAVTIRMPEVEIHATALYTMLTKRYIRPIPAWFSLLATIGVSLGMGVVFLHQGPRRSAILLGTFLIGLGGGAHLLFVGTGWWMKVLSFGVSLSFNYLLTVLIELRQLHRATEEALLRMAMTVEGSSPRSSRTSTLEFWTNIARSISRFLPVDSMVFLERTPPSASLHVSLIYPESAKETLHIEHHTLHVEPYRLATQTPLLFQHYVKNDAVDSWVVPLLSGHEVIGFWVLNLREGRPYFERNAEMIRYFARQIELELIRRQVLIENEASQSSLVRRFLEIYRRHSRSEELLSLTTRIVEERTRVLSALNGLADGLLLYDLFGQLILFNESAYQITHEVISDLVNTPLHEFLYRLSEASGSVENPETTRSEITQRLERVIRSKEGDVYLLTLGETPRRYFQCMLTPIEDTSDPAFSQTIGVTCLLNDISMFSNVPDYAHLIETISEQGRNLLTPMMGLTPLLAANEELTLTQRHALEIIRRNIEELSAIFHELRNVTPTPPSQTTEEIPSTLDVRLPVDIPEVLQEVLAFRKENARIRMNQETGFVERVWGHRLLIQGALESLLRLTEAFLPPEEGWVEVSVFWEERGQVSVKMALRGTAVLPSQLQEYLQIQVSASASIPSKTLKKEELTHLPLPEIRHIVETLHGGRLICLMNENEPLTFLVELPTSL